VVVRNNHLRNNFAVVLHFSIALSFAAFSGVLSGLLGSSILKSSPKMSFFDNSLSGIYATIFISIFLGFGELSEFKNTIKKLSVIFFTALMFSSISSSSSFFVDTFFFASAAILIYLVPSTLLQRVSFLILDLTRNNKNYKNITGITSGLGMISISAFTAYIDLGDNYIKAAYVSQKLALALGCFIVLLMSYANWKSLKTRKRKQSNMAVFKPFAIALCTFGNTSFHNKDLSHTDFTNADLANIDLRASRFDRTCFRGATGLDRARLDNRYFDIDCPKVQQLLTQGTSTETDFNGLNLQGAYLKQAEMPNFALIGTNFTLADLSGSSLRNTNLSRANLSGADLTGADLQDSMLVQADLTGADLTGADLTGACIENWNINGRTNFSDVQCDYIYRKLDDTGKSTDRYPRDRNFERGEFTALYQEAENVAELFFKEGVNWRIFAFSLQKLQLEDEDLDLQLRTIEKRGDRWAITVTHNKNVPSELVERQLEAAYANLQPTFTAQEPKINQLLGIMSDQAKALSTQAEALNNQAEALKEFSKKNFGGLFYITGSTITNLTGSGQIEYTEAANQVRNLVANNTNNAQATQIAQQFLSQLQNQLAPTESEQAELIHQIILAEAAKDVLFRQFILQQSTTLLEVMPPGPITTAFQAALKTLQS
jgi:uncharacterized protein YjbI with pentapeptide repeats